jgi:membrane-bound serine protease (ClpP class)
MEFLLIVAFLVIGFLFIFFEFFIPGGVLGAFGAILMAISIFLCFRTQGPETGWIVLVSALVLSIVTVIVGFKLVPRTPLGKALILSRGVSKEAGYSAQADIPGELMGKEGVAISDLRPTGIASIDGRRIDVMSDGEYLDAGVRVKVVEVASNRIMVRSA